MTIKKITIIEKGKKTGDTAESRFSDCKYSEYSWFSEGITADHFITVT